MKTALTIFAGLAIATAAYMGLRPGSAPKAPEPADPATLHEGTLAAKQDPAEVFQRALWRRPATDDKILHAERREWTKDGAHGVAHWQWFLEIEPGAALNAWLREQNPFSVHPVASTAVPPISGAPEWFPADYSVYIVHAGGSQGNLVFLRSRTGNTLYAASSGTGFAPGTPALSAKNGPTQTVSQGRLPQTPPTTPLKP
jgi:hypothetical protein